MTIANTHINADAEVVQDTAPLPIGSLFALALAAFVTILTEALPAGLLSQISEGLAISEALAGQLVTVYAIGSLLAAIPLTAATQGMRRRSLLLLAIAGFAVANTVTTLSSHYGLTIVARLLGAYRPGCSGRCWPVMPPAWCPRARKVGRLRLPWLAPLGAIPGRTGRHLAR
ncbi:MFS transporter [Pseudomonas sp. NA13]